jgi:hypothetical protein
MGLKVGSNFVTNLMVGEAQSKKVYQGSNIVYAYPYVTFDEDGGSAVSNKYVY